MRLLSIILLLALAHGGMTDMSQSTADRRFTEIRHLDMAYSFSAPKTKAEWEKRAGYLREQILTGAGLLPMPEKTPLNAHVFGRIEHEDYLVEKVYFESFPGFYVTGNLYRPRGEKGPFPAILNPHGHWARGRLEDRELGSIPGRCINFAKQGYVAFAYDMVGYNDSFQLRHREDLLGWREHLWGLSVGGLQLWNSIRAVDFVLSLPDVDKSRIACTGSSGGGTQTFLLTAVDDRIKYAAPVNMISSTMQGGCVCENPPLIRLDTNNMEIGALTAPRPMLMVSATGDWTVKTPTVEFPAVQGVYKLLGAEDKLACAQMKAEHNYNKDSREAVYAFFGKWILGDPNPERFKEQPLEVDKDEDMLVFARDAKPSNALDVQGFIESRIQASENQLAEMKPHDAKSLDSLGKAYGPALRHALGVEYPGHGDIQVKGMGGIGGDGYTARRLLIERKNRGDAVPALLFSPVGASADAPIALVVHGAGKSALMADGKPGRLVSGLLGKGSRVLAIDCFNTGEHVGPPKSADRLTRRQFYDTYNRTDTANRVQDIVTAIAFAGETLKAQVGLVGIGEAGAWCLLARAFAPNVRRMVVDADRFDSDSDQAFIDKLYAPSLRGAGDIRTAAALISPGELFIHNTGTQFKTDWIADVYRASGKPSALSVRATRASDEAIVEWLCR